MAQKKFRREQCRPERRSARSINVCERMDEPWRLPAEVMCCLLNPFGCFTFPAGPDKPAYAGCQGSAREGWCQKSPLRLLERRNRAAFDGRSSSERGIERGSSAKTVASWPWVGYAVRARTVKKEILDKSFRYQAQSWSKPRRIVAKAEHHAGELFPRPGFIATNMTLTSRFGGAFLQQARRGGATSVR